VQVHRAREQPNGGSITAMNDTPKYTIIQFAEYWIPKEGYGVGQFVIMPPIANIDRRVYPDWEMGLVELGKEGWQIACVLPTTGPTNQEMLLQRERVLDHPPILVDRTAQDE